MYKFRPFNAIDFYKADHRSQYPEGTNLVYSNLTPRSSRLAKKLADFDEELGKYILLDQVEREVEAGGELEDVFIDSRMIRKTTLNEIRERLNNK